MHKCGDKDDAMFLLLISYVYDNMRYVHAGNIHAEADDVSTANSYFYVFFGGSIFIASVWTILYFDGSLLAPTWTECVIYIREWYPMTNSRLVPWWRHQMETFSALLALCVVNSPVPG